MDLTIFEEIYALWKEKDPTKGFWNEIANKFGYTSAEAARSSFRRYRRNFGGDEQSGKSPQESNTGSARVAVFDLEISPLVCYSFGIWEENIGVDQIISDSFIVSWSAKMLNEPTAYADVLTPEEALNHDDYRITKNLWDLLNSCQILIGHNIQNYDLKKFNMPKPLISKQNMFREFQVRLQ